jgi:rRNA maturation protein Nop10
MMGCAMSQQSCCECGAITALLSAAAFSASDPFIMPRVFRGFSSI